MRTVRKTEIHPNDTGAVECVAVSHYGTAGWITVNLSEDETVTVFLAVEQMRELAARLTSAADKRVRRTEAA